MALISRDPFARTELHRENEYSETAGCNWCGRQRISRGGRTYLYRYRTETDSGHVLYDGKKFCSLTCRKAYYA